MFKVCLHKIFNYLLPCSSTPLTASNERASATSLKEMGKGMVHYCYMTLKYAGKGIRGIFKFYPNTQAQETLPFLVFF